MKKFSALWLAIALVAIISVSAAFASDGTYVYSDLYGGVGMLKVSGDKIVTLPTSTTGISRAALGNNVRMFDNRDDYETAVATGLAGFVAVESSGDLVKTVVNNGAKTAANIGVVTAYTQSDDATAAAGTTGLYVNWPARTTAPVRAALSLTSADTGIVTALPRVASIAALEDLRDAALDVIAAIVDARAVAVINAAITHLNTANAPTVATLNAAATAASNNFDVSALNNIMVSLLKVLAADNNDTVLREIVNNSRSLIAELFLLNSMGRGTVDALTVNTNGSLSFVTAIDGTHAIPASYTPTSRFRDLAMLGTTAYLAGEAGVKTAESATTAADFTDGLLAAADADLADTDLTLAALVADAIPFTTTIKFAIATALQDNETTANLNNVTKIASTATAAGAPIVAAAELRAIVDATTTTAMIDALTNAATILATAAETQVFLNNGTPAVAAADLIDAILASQVLNEKLNASTWTLGTVAAAGVTIPADVATWATNAKATALLVGTTASTTIATITAAVPASTTELQTAITNLVDAVKQGAVLNFVLGGLAPGARDNELLGEFRVAAANSLMNTEDIAVAAREMAMQATKDSARTTDAGVKAALTSFANAANDVASALTNTIAGVNVKAIAADEVKGNLYVLTNDSTKIYMWNGTTSVDVTSGDLPTFAELTRFRDLEMTANDDYVTIADTKALYVFKLVDNKLQFIDSYDAILSVARLNTTASFSGEDEPTPAPTPTPVKEYAQTTDVTMTETHEAAALSALEAKGYEFDNFKVVKVFNVAGTGTLDVAVSEDFTYGSGKVYFVELAAESSSEVKTAAAGDVTEATLTDANHTAITSGTSVNAEGSLTGGATYALVEATNKEEEGGNKSTGSSSGGCDAGFAGLAALAVLALIKKSR